MPQPRSSGAAQVAAQRWAAAAMPVKAACLDLALSRCRSRARTFALGIDRPLYFSVHSAVAEARAPGAAR